MAPRIHVQQKASSGTVVARPLLGTATSGFDAISGIRPFVASRASVRDVLRVENVVAMALSEDEETRYRRYQQRERKRLSFQQEGSPEEHETPDASQRLGWLDNGMVLRVWARKGEWTTSAATLADNTFGEDSSEDDDAMDEEGSKESTDSRGGSSENGTLRGRAKSRLLGAVGFRNSAGKPKQKAPEDKIYEYCFSFVESVGTDSGGVDSRARWLLHLTRTLTEASSNGDAIQPRAGGDDAEETAGMHDSDRDNFLLGEGAEEEDEMEHRNWLASVGVLESEASHYEFGDETRDTFSSYDGGSGTMSITGSSTVVAADIWNAAQVAQSTKRAP